MKKRRWITSFLLLAGLLAGMTKTLPAAESMETPSWDWSHWETLPVFHQGRIMPLDALARLEVLQICGREQPRLVFQGKKRSFRSSEIFFSWLVEPELWEEVPFLPLEKEVLRTRMGLPLHDETGQRLSKVSPAEAIRFYTSSEYERLVAELEAAKKLSPDGDYPPAEKELFEALRQLEREVMAYRTVTFHPQTAGTLRTEFMERLVSLMQTWSMSLQPGISKMPLPDKGSAERISANFQTLGQLFWKDGKEQNTQSVSLEALAIPTGKLVRDSETLAKEVETYILQLLQTSAPEGISPPQWQYVQSQSRMHWVKMKQLAIQCNELQYALYDDGTPLNILPSLDAAPLDAWRDESVQMHPWLSLHALLYGSREGILRKFPETAQPVIDTIRKNFAEMVQAWKAKRGKDFTQASEQLTQNIRALALETASIRENLLPAQRRDEEILHATAYPTDMAGLRREVFYYHLSPFLWGWIFPFVSFLLLGLAGILSLVLAQSKDSGGIFHKIQRFLWILGLLFLTLGVGLTTWGLTLRSWIMGRAPVTNMFETIVFVSWTAGVMGIWLSLRQILEPAFFFGWQSTSPQGAKTPAARKIAWGLLPLRLILMGGLVWLLTCAGFGLGDGYNVISLTPRLAIGATSPSLSDCVVWLTGILTLGVLIWWTPRILLTPVGACFWLWQKRRSWNVGGDQKIWFALATSLIVFVISYVAYSCTSLFNANLRNLMPILRDNYWLSVHVVTIVASYGAGMLAWALGNLSLLIYTFGRYPLVQGKRTEPAICQTLSELIYRCMQVAVLLLVIGTILGGLWADVSWGRFWSWDRKEVWALISLLVYLLILHGRYVRLLGEMTLPIGSVLGAMVIIMAWYGVNYILGSALHGYGSGVGSLQIFFLVAGANALLILAAVGRYCGMLGKKEEKKEKV